MNRFLIIPFDFSEECHYSLIMCKDKAEGMEYRITIMNGDLEKVLLGNNVIKEINGYLHVHTSSDDELQNCLKIGIAKSLGKILKIPLKELSSVE